ncbi:MAG: hypothetical protein A3A86_05790 [Elusimicrobia bacterium RIFCSPLOWO2_01_FULL_60_11]|nr:MAG: hypothetical protein A3A86_05790 [Elusimicrobia bacterium RIFCSPLOWO2_01_FULL_60_11]
MGIRRYSWKFKFRRGGKTLEGFAVRLKGKTYAYLNQCRHMTLPLDWGDEDFLTDDKKFILCKNHGALYDPKSGLCVAGPCAGESLEKIEFDVRKG